MFKVYAAYKLSDMTEGKGPMILDQLFEFKSNALAYILDQPGYMGRRADPNFGWTNMGDWEVHELKVFNSLLELKENQQTLIVKGILDKLTEEEISALSKYFSK
jgi:hypothetical protein